MIHDTGFGDTVFGHVGHIISFDSILYIGDALIKTRGLISFVSFVVHTLTMQPFQGTDVVLALGNLTLFYFFQPFHVYKCTKYEPHKDFFSNKLLRAVIFHGNANFFGSLSFKCRHFNSIKCVEFNLCLTSAFSLNNKWKLV